MKFFSDCCYGDLSGTDTTQGDALVAQARKDFYNCGKGQFKCFESLNAKYITPENTKIMTSSGRDVTTEFMLMGPNEAFNGKLWGDTSWVNYANQAIDLYKQGQSTADILLDDGQNKQPPRNDTGLSPFIATQGGSIFTPTNIAIGLGVVALGVFAFLKFRK